MTNKELWISYQENPTVMLKQKIVLTYLNLVHYVIHLTNFAFSNSGIIERRDLFQFGIEGLSKAIDRFEFERGIKFETYAIGRIRGEIHDKLRESIGKYYYGYNFKDSPPVEISLDIESFELNKKLSKNKEGPDLLLEIKEIREFILGGLDNREKTIINLYYYEGLNMEEIGKKLGKTKGRISQIHKEVLKNLKLKLKPIYSELNL